MDPAFQNFKAISGGTTRKGRATGRLLKLKKYG